MPDKAQDKLLLALSGRGTINGEYVSSARCGKDEVAKTLEGFRTYSFALPLKQTAQVLFGLTEEQMWNDKLKNVPIEAWGMSPRLIYQRLGTEGAREVFDPSMWATQAMFVWDDVREGRPNATQHTSPTATTSAPPASIEDFERMIRIAAQTMFQLSDADIFQSETCDSNLSRWPFSFAHIVETIKTKTIPAILDLPPEEAMLRFVEVRSTLPFVEKSSQGPYGTPPDVARGVVVPDCRFDNEADIVRENGGHVIHVCRELPPGIEVVKGHASEQGVSIKPGDLQIVNDGSLEDLRNKAQAALVQLSPNWFNTPTQGPGL